MVYGVGVSARNSGHLLPASAGTGFADTGFAPMTPFPRGRGGMTAGAKWIPAFAGMTRGGAPGTFRHSRESMSSRKRGREPIGSNSQV